MPSSILSNKTPYEVLFGHLLSFAYLKVFGCLCYVSTLAHHRDKFSLRATKCVFLRYHFGVKGYKVMDLHTHSVLISRDVQFHEFIFPFQSQVPSQSIDPFDTCFDFGSLLVLPTPLLDEHTPILLNPDSPIADTAIDADTAIAIDTTTTENCTNSAECISSHIPPSIDTHFHSSNSFPIQSLLHPLFHPENPLKFIKPLLTYKITLVISLLVSQSQVVPVILINTFLMPILVLHTNFLLLLQVLRLN